MKKLNFSSLTLFVAAFMGMSNISANDSSVVGPDGNTYTLAPISHVIALPTKASEQARANWADNAANRSNKNVTFAPGSIVDRNGNFILAHNVNGNQSYAHDGNQWPQAIDQVRSLDSTSPYI